MLNLSSKTTKSYATEANLIKALNSMNLSNFRGIICKTVEGRFTYVFAGFVQNAVGTGFMMLG